MGKDQEEKGMWHNLGEMTVFLFGCSIMRIIIAKTQKAPTSFQTLF